LIDSNKKPEYFNFANLSPNVANTSDALAWYSSNEKGGEIRESSRNYSSATGGNVDCGPGA